MLLDFKQLVEKYKMEFRGVIQVGAHYAEEYDMFREAGAKHFVFVEPCTPAFTILKEKFSSIHKDPENDTVVALFNRALADYEGVGIMNVETRNSGQSNSLLEPKMHLNQFPDIVFHDKEEVNVTTLDSLDIDMSIFNTLVMDTQGTELRVLMGGKNKLPYIDYIFTEVNRAELYVNCAQIEQLDQFLEQFSRIETHWAGGNWGDALYIRKTLL